MASKKFKRYYTGHNTSPSDQGPNVGKGSWRRETQIAAPLMQRQWCSTFGHHLSMESFVCKACGASIEEVDVMNEEFKL